MRPSGRTIEEATQRTDQPQTRWFPSQGEYGELHIDVMNQGMVLTVAREQTGKGMVRIAKNVRVRDYWAGTREGTVELMGKPDSDPVIALLNFYRNDGRTYILRVTTNSIHGTEVRGTGGWSLLGGSMGGMQRRMSFCHFIDDVYMADGVDPIRRVSLSSWEYGPIAEAPRGQYITAFGDRILSAKNGYTTRGILVANVAWCVNSDPFHWLTLPQRGDSDHLADNRLTAGEVDLIGSPTDSGDEITGVTSIGELAVLFRKRSIWEITRQPVSTAPFRFQPVVSDMGCDLPYTIVRGPGNTAIFADARTNGVYIYSAGGRLQRLSAAIEHPGHGVSEHLFETLTDKYWTQGSYDPFTGEYHLLIA